MSPASPKSPHPAGGCKKKTPTRDAKKNPPTNNLAAAVAREMVRDARGAASCLAEPLPPPPGGHSPGVIVGARGQAGKQKPADHIPPLSPLSSEQRAWTRQWADGQWRTADGPPNPPHRQLVPLGLPGLPERSGWGARAQLAADPSLAPARIGFSEKGLNRELGPLSDGK